MLNDKVKYIITGTLAGVANGLFGSGGGLFLVPLFVSWLHMEQKKAFATSGAGLALPAGRCGGRPAVRPVFQKGAGGLAAAGLRPADSLRRREGGAAFMTGRTHSLTISRTEGDGR